MTCDSFPEGRLFALVAYVQCAPSSTPCDQSASTREYWLDIEDGTLVRRVVHFAEDGDTSGFFPGLAKYHDRQKYQMTFATLKPMAVWLEEFMRERGVETYSCNAGGRLHYPRALVQLARNLRAHRCDLFHAHLFDPSVVALTQHQVITQTMRVTSLITTQRDPEVMVAVVLVIIVLVVNSLDQAVRVGEVVQADQNQGVM